MAFAHSKDSVFSMDDSGGTLRALTAFTDSVSGLPGGRGLSSVTAFGDLGEKNIPSTANVTFSAGGSWDNTATTGPDAVLSSLRTATATASFEWGPEGATTGDIKYSGECWLTDYTTDTSVTNKVTWQASFQVDGVVTRGTYS